MKTIRAYLLLASVLPIALGADVTLVRLNPTPSLPAGEGSLTVSGTVVGATPYAVDQSSSTLYRVTEVDSLIVYQSGTVTATILSEPTTSTWTYRSGASGHNAQYPTLGLGGAVVQVEEACKNLAGGNMECVQGLGAGEKSVEAVFVAGTITAPGVPFATISNVESLTLPTTSIAPPSDVPVVVEVPDSSGMRSGMHLGAALVALGTLAGVLLV